MNATVSAPTPARELRLSTRHRLGGVVAQVDLPVVAVDIPSATVGVRPEAGTRVEDLSGRKEMFDC